MFSWEIAGHLTMATLSDPDYINSVFLEKIHFQLCFAYGPLMRPMGQMRKDINRYLVGYTLNPTSAEIVARQLCEPELERRLEILIGVLAQIEKQFHLHYTRPEVKR